MKQLALLLLGSLPLAVPAPAGLYHETWRPQFHFTPARHWMNDPNGLVYLDGEYHLFFQHNPEGIQWGHMSWGHAVTRDLVHWEELPVAIPESPDVMIFSGSAVVDAQNTAGFGGPGQVPLVAIYTGHYTGKRLENQHLAYSLDHGRTWTKYAGNPVLDIGAADFRDPKVFWHEPTHRWIMAASWPDHRQIRFYASPDLKHWQHLSDFGPAGATEGIWECPDLFTVPVEGHPGERKWMLVVNVNGGPPAGGSGTQYFVGEFDGERFRADDPAAPAAWADWAWDFYAAVSWGNLPANESRRLWLGWMSNWQYAPDVPTTPWRSAMTTARAMELRRTPEGWRMLQQPVRELQALRGRPVPFTPAELGGTAPSAGVAEVVGGPCELELDLQPDPAAVFALEFRTGPAEAVVLQVDLPRHALSLDRRQSGVTNFSPKFPGIATGPLRLVDGRLRLRLLLDASSLEVFANDGETVLSSLVLPTGGPRRIALQVKAGGVPAGHATAWPLASIWPAEK